MSYIREFDRVNYSPIPGQPPTIENAEIYKLDLKKEEAWLTGYTFGAFPLTHLTKCRR